MKSFTDIEQSKKLAEILPLESADMYWWPTSIRYYIDANEDDDFNEDEGHIRAWSLAALLDAIPLEIETHKQSDGYKTYYYVESYMKHIGKDISLSTERHENLVDACYEMVFKLKEMDLL